MFGWDWLAFMIPFTIAGVVRNLWVSALHAHTPHTYRGNKFVQGSFFTAAIESIVLLPQY